jgi:hypothetical protein
MGLPGDNKEYWINRALALDAKLRELVEAAEWYLEDNHYGAPRRQRLEAALAAAKGE